MEAKSIPLLYLPDLFQLIFPSLTLLRIPNQPLGEGRSFPSLYLFLFPHLTLFRSERFFDPIGTIDYYSIHSFIDWPTIDTVHPFVIYDTIMIGS